MKQLMFSIFSIVLVVQVFLGTTGVVVYEHHCKKDGTSRSFFVAQGHERDFIQESKACDKLSCCSINEDVSEDFPFIQKETCCTNSLDFIHLDADLALDNNDYNIEAAFISSFNEEIINVSMQTFSLLNEYRGPPPLTNSRRLASLQTYLI